MEREEFDRINVFGLGNEKLLLKYLEKILQMNGVKLYQMKNMINCSSIDDKNIKEWHL